MRGIPPRDPLECPALERAMPADAVAEPWRPDNSAWLVLFGNGKWRVMMVKAWRKDRVGRDVVDVEFWAQGSTWSEAYVVDPKKMYVP